MDQINARQFFDGCIQDAVLHGYTETEAEEFASRATGHFVEMNTEDVASLTTMGPLFAALKRMGG